MFYPGGATNKGVTIKTYKKFSEDLFGLEGSVANLKNLTNTQAMLIYQVGYWKPSGAHRISDAKIANLYFDTRMHGVGTSVLNSTLSGFGKKGVSGLNTVLKTQDASSIHYLFKCERICRFDRIIEKNSKLSKY